MSNTRPRNRGRHPIFIQQWRVHRGLSQRELAERARNGNGRPVLSYASVSRIERGLQPYDRDTLEALAEALGCEPADLLGRDPQVSRPIWTLWQRLDEEQREQARAVIEALARLR